MSDSLRDPGEDTPLFPPSNPEDEAEERPLRLRAPGEPEQYRAEIIRLVAVISLFPIFGLI